MLGGLHDTIVAELGWPERVSVGEAKIGPSEWFSWKDKEKVADSSEKEFVAAFGNIPGVWTMKQSRFKDGYGHLWWEDEKDNWGDDWKDGVVWKGKEVKLRVTPVGGDTCEMIWRHMQDVDGELEEGTEKKKATRVKEIWGCSKNVRWNNDMI